MLISHMIKIYEIFNTEKACTKIQHPVFSFSVLTLMKKFSLKAEKIIKNTHIKFYT